MNKKTFIQLPGGRRFWPLKAEGPIVLSDIAGALSKINRYTGHTTHAYCPTVDSRVLKDDLTWVPAGELKVGDRLLAFDEDPVDRGAGPRRRQYRGSIVTKTDVFKLPCVRLTLETGELISSSSEHPWLAATKLSRNQKWMTAGQLYADTNCGISRYLHYFFTPWSTNSSWESGWLAGIYDGEGSLAFSNRRGFQLSVAQKKGPTADRIVDVHTRLGFPLNAVRPKCGFNDVYNFQLEGGWRRMASLLGTIRPLRLVDKFQAALRSDCIDKELQGKGFPKKIVHAESIGEKWVSAIETSSRTYFCDGFGAHNSVALHSVNVARVLPDELKLWGLLHDASEAYLGDVARPIKYPWWMWPYRRAEDRLLRRIADEFGLCWPVPPEVKEADNRMLATEVRHLFKTLHPDWETWLRGIEPYADAPTSWFEEQSPRSVQHLYEFYVAAWLTE